MLNKIDGVLDFHAQALKLRAERQRTLASNIANSDTPNYKAVDFDFSSALKATTSASSVNTSTLAATDSRHIQGGAGPLSGADMKFRIPTQLALDGNTVEMDMERAQFADNAIRYEATLKFLNMQIKSLSTAIQGQ